MTDAGDVIWRNGRPEEVATHYSGHLIEKNRLLIIPKEVFQKVTN